MKRSRWLLNVLFIVFCERSVIADPKRWDKKFGKTGHIRLKNDDFDFAHDVRLLDGSGDGNEFDKEDFSGDFGGAEVTAPRPSLPIIPDTECLRRLRELENHRMPGAFIPRCTENGEYEALQCHGSTGMCYCANKYGEKIPGTSKYPPHMPDCSLINRDAAVWIASTSRPPSDGNPYLSKSSLPPYVYPGHKDDTKHNHNTLWPEFSNGDHSYKGQESQKLSKTFLGEPGVLAGIIAGATVGLLCAILLIMFVIYRLRHNRHYADEKANKVPIIGYANGHDRDLYA